MIKVYGKTENGNLKFKKVWIEKHENLTKIQGKWMKNNQLIYGEVELWSEIFRSKKLQRKIQIVHKVSR